MTKIKETVLKGFCELCYDTDVSLILIKLDNANSETFACHLCINQLKINDIKCKIVYEVSS